MLPYGRSAGAQVITGWDQGCLGMTVGEAPRFGAFNKDRQERMLEIPAAEERFFRRRWKKMGKTSGISFKNSTSEEPKVMFSMGFRRFFMCSFFS